MPEYKSTNLRLSPALYRLSYSSVSTTEGTRTPDLFINSEVRLVFGTGHPLFSCQSSGPRKDRSGDS